jgi:hypothetical protein
MHSTIYPAYPLIPSRSEASRVREFAHPFRTGFSLSGARYASRMPREASRTA